RHRHRKTHTHSRSLTHTHTETQTHKHTETHVTVPLQSGPETDLQLSNFTLFCFTNKQWWTYSASLTGISLMSAYGHIQQHINHTNQCTHTQRSYNSKHSNSWRFGSKA